MRLKLSDMTPELRARVESAIGKYPIAEAIQKNLQYIKETAVKETTRKGPNKTEAEYNRIYLHGLGLYEAITLRLPGGSRYTPDWITVQGSQVTCHECKGAYRHASQGRALTAFRECVAAFPFFRFVWAVKEATGWKVKEYGGVK